MVWKTFTSFCGCLLFLSFPIWCGMFFGIYYPFFIEFTSATCRVDQELWTYSTNGYTLRQQSVQLFVNNNTYLAVMCESDANTLTPGGSDFWGYYAYDWVYCPMDTAQFEYCLYSQQVIPPRWMCNDLTDNLQQEQAEPFECWYKSDFNGIDNMILESDWTQGFFYLPPQSRTVAMRQKSPNIHEPSYLVVQIVCLGIFVIPSFISVFFLGIPAQYNWVCYTKPYRACRRRLDCCWPYYDMAVQVQDRHTLFVHAATTSPEFKLHPSLRKVTATYIAHDTV